MTSHAVLAILLATLASASVAAASMPQRQERPAAERPSAERPGQDDARSAPSVAEVADALKELKKSRRAGDRNKHLTVVLRSDSVDGRRYVSNMLRGAFDGPKRNVIKMMGENSPSSWWEVAVEHLDSRDDDVRAAVAEALTRFAEPKATRPVRARILREKVDAVRGALVLALAASGPDDATVAAELDKLSESDKTAEAVRMHAVLGAGRISDDEVALRIVRRALGDASTKVRAAAATASAAKKLTKAVPDLRTAAEHETDADTKRFLQAAMRAVETGDTRQFDALRRRLEQRDARARGGDATTGGDTRSTRR